MTDNLTISLFEQTEDDSIFIKECENWEEASKEMMATGKKNPDKVFKIKGFVKQEDGSVKLQEASYCEDNEKFVYIITITNTSDLYKEKQYASNRYLLGNEIEIRIFADNENKAKEKLFSQLASDFPQYDQTKWEILQIIEKPSMKAWYLEDDLGTKG
jgi:uncharacterized phage-like protein YoqJ